MVLLVFFGITIESIQQTNKVFFTLAAYKLHALCVKENFPGQPLPLITLHLDLKNRIQLEDL